jgi:5'-nucleotidase
MSSDNQKFSDRKLVVAISSRALFDLAESHKVYEEQGVEAYCAYQIEHENDILSPGVAFPLVHKLTLLNKHFPGIEVILMSHNSPDIGLRIFNSIQHHKLDIVRAAFTGGRAPYRYVGCFGAHLYLSANASDVRSALELGYAAASLIPVVSETKSDTDELRIAFDGDAVLFSDESEQIYQKYGLKAFSENEIKSASVPLKAGPFAKFLLALHDIQELFPQSESPIRTALVTSRAAPAHERVIRTLRHWGIRLDEALFLGGHPKSEFVKSFGADIFFDDQEIHCSSTREHVATGHVPHGISNIEKE